MLYPMATLVADLGHQHRVLVGVVQRLDDVVTAMLEIPPAEELQEQQGHQPARHVVIDLDLERKPRLPTGFINPFLDRIDQAPLELLHRSCRHRGVSLVAQSLGAGWTGILQVA